MDWNNDGYTDLICGDRNGKVSFFERNSDGTLQSRIKLRSSGSFIDPGSNSSPDFVDWDNDGDLDMIVGCEGSYPDGNPIRVYINTGTVSSYQFDGYFEFTAAGSVPTYYRSMPSIFDMNNDGLFDIVVGASDKTFHYFENTGTPGNPSFAADSPLEYANGGIITANSSTRLDINDWNGDGLPDLVTGNSAVYLYLYTAVPGVSVEGSTAGIMVPSALSMKENPVQSDLSVNINLGAPAVACFAVYTMDGRVVLNHTTGTLAPGHNTVTIPGNLANGSYLLRCSAGNRELTERFAVVR